MTTGRAMVDRSGGVVRLPDEVVEHSPAPNAFLLQAASRQLEAIARLYGVAVDRSEVLHRSEPIKLYAGFDPEEV